MRAVITDHPGAPSVLRPVTLPDPAPGSGQVRVSVEVAAITFVETLVRAGSTVVPPATFPAVLGNGVGGTVDRIGPGVDRDWLGARVVTTTGGTGGYAELALARATDLHRVPGRLGLPDATALLADGRTAVGLHEAARVRESETVIVTAAAGGVGGVLVQLATTAGARVVALAGSDPKLAHARDLGAEVTVNYRDPAWARSIREAAPRGVDVAFDGIGGDTTTGLAELLRPGGRLVRHGAAGGRWGTLDEAAIADRGITVLGLGALGAADLFALTERALELAVEGALQATIGQTFPLAEAASAHAAIESRTTIGKTLLLP
ncbi:zinc-binding dehydrogenase [Saccharomonospora piscinae]|uniref:zinc-binding dehydrogenase n=1 Tax=Saccharomonospora piscinae TaxID=687388 RepID=UPI0004644698|nr:zinc-binding dehydrogenase [Saccharomonospora piscinae]